MLFTKFSLSNGLTVIHHPDTNSRLVVLNVLYKVGSKNENPDRTGFAHLFEHLMFGGSENIPDYDTVLQLAGGDNNAWTSNDLTNYYLSLPYNNAETGFWLESDRMLKLDFNQDSLDVQKSVVQEEFKERYLNQPYGDLWLKLLPLAYQQHPYLWPTIGKSLQHIADTTLNEVERFFYSHYAPNNAILVVAGNISLDETKRLCEKWFGDIPSRDIDKKVWSIEPKQTSPRFLELSGNVPVDLLAKAWHMAGRMEDGYYEADLFSDILGMGKSSRLYQKLVKEQNLFSEIDCYITGDVEPGLLIIEGKVQKGIDLKVADEAVENLISDTLSTVTQDELIKVKNKTETTIRFGDVNLLNRASKLAYCEMLGDINLAITEIDKYRAVDLSSVISYASKILTPSNCSTIYYKAQ